MSGADKPAKKNGAVEYELNGIESYEFAAAEAEYENARRYLERAQRGMDAIAAKVLQRVGAEDVPHARCAFAKNAKSIVLKVGAGE